MGLTLSVGFLAEMIELDPEGANWFRGSLQQLNVALEAAGLMHHVEPEQCVRLSDDMFGYFGLHYPRRIAAHLCLRKDIPPPGNDDAAHDAVLLEYINAIENQKKSIFGRLFPGKSISRDFDHLINHSDAEGYYVPQDFSDVIFPAPNLDIPGGMIGSSQRLLRELLRIADVLELPIDLDPDCDELIEAAEHQGADETRKWKRYGMESYACLQLMRAAKVSIEQSALLVFT